MKIKPAIIIIALTALATSCTRDADFSSPPVLPTPQEDNGVAKSPPDTTECSTAACIDDFFDNWVCAAPALLMPLGTSTYTVSGTYILDNCDPYNWVIGAGESPTTRPTIYLTGSPIYNNGTPHATLHFVENLDANDPSGFHDIKIKTASRMDNGTVPGIQFEACSVNLDNVHLQGGASTTTHFLAVFDVEINDIVLDSNHELVFGVEEWCGEPGCGGPGHGIPADGMTITDSELYGDIIFDVFFAGSSDNTMTVEGNDPLTYLQLDVEATGAGDAKVVLEDNVFPSGGSAKVKILGDYLVEAISNETQRGPCEDDALEDFDDQASGLTLTSWEYDGVTYTSDPSIVISNIDTSFNPLTCEKTVTWTTNFPSSSTVLYGSSCALGQVASTPGNVTSHTVVCDVSTTGSNFYFKVQSSNTCDTETSSCQGEKRGTCIAE